MLSAPSETRQRSNRGIIFPPNHYHVFHGDADVLSGELKLPIQQKIEKQVPVSLNDRRGGHFTRLSEEFSVEGLISYKRGETRVSGNPSSKPRGTSDHVGWTTLSTSTVEQLNVFEIMTADRIVSQVSTDHAYENGHVPFVTFLGTQYRNVRVGGYGVKPIMDLGIAGPDPESTVPYVNSSKFFETVLKQNLAVLKAPKLPADVKKRYEESRDKVEEFLGLRKETRRDTPPPIVFSLVTGFEFEGRPIKDQQLIPGLKDYAHVLTIPEFGVAAFGEVELTIEAGEQEANGAETNGSAGGSQEYDSYSFALSMLKMDLGCVGQGTVKAGNSGANGTGRP